jgi:hypothetical protein
MKTLLAAAMLLSTSTASIAQDAPTLGILYNTQEGHSLTYRCDPVRANQLNCEFVQTAVRLKAGVGQLPSVLAQARQQFRTEKPPTAQDCGTFKEILDIMDGKKTAPKPEALAALTPVEKADAQRSARVFLEYCSKPTEENYLGLARFGHEKDRRTCTVSSNSYKQSFRPLTEGGGAVVWVTQSTPDGPCGVVQLSRFEPEETKIGTSKFTNWKYIARKAITNPSGELFPGAKCSGLDEKPYTYDWRSKEHQMTCDYIQFSPI